MANIDRGPLPQDNFTMVSNDWLRDKRLSWKARGLLAWLASHELGFQVSLSRIVAASERDGREAARAAIKELETCGYLLRSKDRDDAGRITSATYTLVDACPDCTEDPNALVNSKVGFPDVGKPDDGSADVGSSDVGSTDGGETRPHKKTSSSKKINGEKTAELALVQSDGSTGKPKTTRKPNRVTIPDDWALTPELIDWAKTKTKAPGLQWLQQEAERFILDAHAEGRTHVNWDMAFQKWIHNELKWAAERGRVPTSSRPVGRSFPGQGMFS